MTRAKSKIIYILGPFHIKTTIIRSLSIGVLLIFGLSCVPLRERDTQVFVQGGNPPSFLLKGSGDLSQLWVRGPKKQREIYGEPASYYWMIQVRKGNLKPIEKLSPMIYGKVPDGYMQVYPENGSPPDLLEGELYWIWVDTRNANCAGIYFTIKDGKAVQVE